MNASRLPDDPLEDTDSYPSQPAPVPARHHDPKTSAITNRALVKPSTVTATPGVGTPGEVCRSDAERYIAALTGDPGMPCTWQLFGDHDKSLSPRILEGSLAKVWQELVAYNRKGYGVFVTVNKTDGRGRLAANVVALRAVFVDDDGGKLSVPATLPPTLAVRSAHGLHVYWRLRPGAPLDQFTPAQAQLAGHFGTDTRVKDLSRVMRLPGLFHLKDPNAPYLVRIEVVEPQRIYTLDEVVAAYPAEVRTLRQRAPRTPRSGASTAASDVEATAATASVVRRAERYTSKVPGAAQGQGGDTATFRLAATLTRGFGLSDAQALVVLKKWNKTCQPPWSEVELREKVVNGRTYGDEEVGGRLKQLQERDLAFIPSHGVYYARRGGRWDLKAPIRRSAAAVAHLVGHGIDPDDARDIVNDHRVLIADNVDCYPNASDLVESAGRRCLNTWTPPDITPAAGTWPRIMRLIDVVTDGDATARAWLLNWMAFKVQRPGERPLTAPILVGEQGTGKSTLADVMRAMVGTKNTCAISQRDLDGSFNGHYADKLFIVGEEVATSENRRDISGHLKQAISNASVSVNIKSVPQYEIINRAAYWFNTNATKPLDIEDGDRRYSVIFSRIKGVEENPELRELLRSCYESGEFSPTFRSEVAALLNDLLAMTVDEVLVRTALDSNYKKDLVKACRSSHRAFWAEVVDCGIEAMMLTYSVRDDEEWRGPSGGVIGKDLYRAYKAWCQDNGYAHPLGFSTFGVEMNRLGAEKKRESTGGRRWYYILPQGQRQTADEEAADGAEAQSVADLIKEEHDPYAAAFDDGVLKSRLEPRRIRNSAGDRDFAKKPDVEPPPIQTVAA